MTVAVLFARADSHYKAMGDMFASPPAVDVWDAQRDALRWPGGCPVVAHPPCRGWGGLRHMATRVRAGEKELGLWAVEQVRKWGGVLEHPKGSTLWKAAGMPAIEERDEYGGWTLEIHQHWWGHKAEKATWLYIVGCEPDDIPPIRLRTTRPTHVVSTGHGLREGDPGFRSRVTDAEREHTPPALAQWLVELAAKCKTHNDQGKPRAKAGEARCSESA